MIRVSLPLKTTNSQNGRGHLFARSGTTKKERRIAHLAVKAAPKRPVLTVKLTRCSAGELDDDNLRGALKAVRDGIADALRVDDGSPLIFWEYHQARCAKGQHSVEIEITPRTEVSHG